MFKQNGLKGSIVVLDELVDKYAAREVHKRMLESETGERMLWWDKEEWFVWQVNRWFRSASPRRNHEFWAFQGVDDRWLVEQGASLKEPDAV